MPLLGALCAVVLVSGAVTAPSSLADELPPTSTPAVRVAAVDGEPGTLDLSWTAPTDGPVDGYEVSVGDRVASLSDTHLLVRGLADNTAYPVRVAVRNAAGVGPAAEAIGTTVPAAPTLAAVAGNGTADLSWTAPDGLEGFVVGGSAFPVPQLVDGTVRTHHVAGLVNGAPASFTVVARNAAGSSAPATAVTTPRVPGELLVLSQPAPSVVYGTSTVLRAGLRTVAGVGVPGESVQLLARTRPASAYSHVTTATTDASGNVSFRATLSANTSLVVRHLDNAFTAADVAPRSVAVAPRFGAVRASRSLRVRQLLTVTGGVAPARTIGAPVVLQRRTATGWATVATGKMTTRSGYAVTWRPQTARSHVLRVVSPADAVRAPGASASWPLAVRNESAVDVAREILADPSIRLEGTHPNGVSDGASPLQQIRDIAAGRLVRRSSFGTAPGGYTAVDLRLLRALRLMGRQGSVVVSEIAGGSHASRSLHYPGRALDITWVNGRHVGSGASYALAVNACRSYGAWRVFSPSYDPYGGHGNHVHCDWS